MIQIRLSGSGGQGLILAGIILAEAAISEGKEAVQSQSYGPAARGGSSKAEVIISDQPILFPHVLVPDVLLAMNQQSMDRYYGDLSPKAKLIIDSTFVKKVPTTAKNIYSVPITQLSREKLGRDLFANIIALGVLAKVSGTVSLQAMTDAVLARVPKGTEEKNSNALQIGYEAV